VVSGLFGGRVTAAAVKGCDRKADSCVPKNVGQQRRASGMPLAATVKSQMLRLLRRSKSTREQPARSSSSSGCRKGKASGEHAMVITNKRLSAHVDCPPPSNKAVGSRHAETRKQKEDGYRPSSRARRHSRSQVVRC
jgi:hypothetical protein